MTTPPHDRPDQLEKIQNGLLDGEQIHAVYDCIGAGTGFVGLTTKRLILQDNSFVGKKVAVTSFPYRHVRAVSMLTNKSFAGAWFSSSSIAINIGGTTHEVDFRGEEKAKHVHDLVLYYMLQG